jgi:protein gp37
MGTETKIEWCDKTFNPWVGCTRISPGCDHCYAAAWTERFKMAKWGPGENRVRTTESNWKLPLKWDREAEKTGTCPRVFCASLADVFDNEVPDAWRMDLFALIGQTPNITWLILTKRIGNVQEYCRRDGQAFDLIGSDRVWLGATICNQEEADRDIPKLLDTPAAVRWISAEPLLGQINVGPYLSRTNMSGLRIMPGFRDPLPGIDWVVSGGESGAHARPANPDWFRSLRDQCATAGVPFFMKQMGGSRDKRGALDDLPVDLRVREWPTVEYPIARNNHY